MPEALKRKRDENQDAQNVATEAAYDLIIRGCTPEGETDCYTVMEYLRGLLQPYASIRLGLTNATGQDLFALARDIALRGGNPAPYFFFRKEDWNYPALNPSAETAQRWLSALIQYIAADKHEGVPEVLAINGIEGIKNALWWLKHQGATEANIAQKDIDLLCEAAQQEKNSRAKELAQEISQVRELLSTLLPQGTIEQEGRAIPAQQQVRG